MIVAEIHQVIRTSASINEFDVTVMEHVRKTFGEVNLDIVGGVDLQDQRNGRSVLSLLSLSVRQKVTPPPVQGVRPYDVAGRHLRESCRQFNLQKINSILRQ